MYIYKITNLVNNKIYIGQTIQTTRIRFNQHCTNKTMLIGKAIQKHGRENFKIEVINEFATIDELNYFEEYYIRELNSLVPHGYNLDSGGKNCIVHEDTRKKMAELFKDRVFPEQAHKRAKEVNMGNNYVLNKKHSFATSKFYGVYKTKDKYKSSIFTNDIVKTIVQSKSELYCAYMYDQYCIENNLKERRLNNISHEEAMEDYYKYYKFTSKYIGVFYKKDRNRYRASICMNNKTKHIGSYKTELEAVKAYNQYIIDNKLNKKLNII